MSEFGTTPLESIFDLATQTPVGRLQTLTALLLIIEAKVNRRAEDELSAILKVAADKVRYIITEDELRE